MAEFNHTLGAVQPLNLIFNLSTSVGCGSYSVCRTDVTSSMKVGTLSSLREIIDLGDLTKSRIQQTHGQSGLPFSKHFSDTLQDWRTVNLHPMLWARADVEARQEGLLVLTPP